MKALPIILFLFLSTILSSQTWTNYNPKKVLDLYSTGLYDLEIDSQNNIWFASLSGLLKYDGTNWTVYDTLNSEIASNKLSSVSVDQNGNIWCGLGENKGISILDGNIWTTYNRSNSDFDPYTVRDIVFDNNNNPWFGTDIFLWTYQNNKWLKIKYIKENTFDIFYPVNEVKVDKYNDIWFTTKRNGIYKYSVSRLNNYTHINPYTYEGLAIDSNNNLWFINNQKSLMHYNKEWIVRDTTETPISSGFGIPHTIIVDKNNTLWIAEKRNLHNFNPTTEIWKTYTAHDSLYDPTQGTNSFIDFKIDASGNSWFITPNAGVFKLSGVITDVKDEKILNNISIYPNPTSTLLSYETNNITSIIQQSIVDLSGKVLMNDNIDNTMSNSIDVSKFQSGVYFLQLTDTKGVKYSKKFVIED